jgi:DNA-directed RNA polymerase subunit RPC12/RpoP
MRDDPPSLRHHLDAHSVIASRAVILTQPTTIRRRLRAWFLFLRLGVFAVGVLGALWRDDGYNHQLRVAVLGFAFFGVLGLFVLGFRCPRCGRTLLASGTTILTSDARIACPRCGLDIDGPPPLKSAGGPRAP